MQRRALEHAGRALRHEVVVLDAEGPRTPTAPTDAEAAAEHVLSLSELRTVAGDVALAAGVDRAAERLLPNLRFAAVLARDGHEVDRPGYDFAPARRLGHVPEAKAREDARDLRPSWGPWRDRESVRALDRLFARADRAGLEPVVVLPPYSPPVLRLGGAPLRDAHDRMVRWLRAERRRHPLRIVDLTDIRAFGGDPADFADGVHVGPANAERMLTAVLDRARGAL
jgi:hypothetical protein